jgi:hypothetical protein
MAALSGLHTCHNRCPSPPSWWLDDGHELQLGPWAPPSPQVMWAKALVHVAVFADLGEVDLATQR